MLGEVTLRFLELQESYHDGRSIESDRTEIATQFMSLGNWFAVSETEFLFL